MDTIKRTINNLTKKFKISLFPYLQMSVFETLIIQAISPTI